MLLVSSGAFTIVRMDKLEITPWVALCLLKPGIGILTPALIIVLEPAVGSCHYHQLRQRFGQHAQVLLAGFEPLLSPFLLLNIGAGAKPLDELALGIFERLCSDQEPAIRSGRAIAQALFHFIRPACLDGVLPPRLDAWPVIRMNT